MKGAAMRGAMKRTIAAGLALAGLAALAAPAVAEQKKVGEKKYSLHYTGDPKVCLPFLFEAKKIEVVRPTIRIRDMAWFGPPREVDGRLHNLQATVLRFADFDVDSTKFWEIVEGRKWAKLFKPGTWPKATDYGYVVADKRWRRLNLQCPGILMTEFDGQPAAPDDFALFLVDIDNDRRQETVLVTQNDYHWHQNTLTFTVYDFKACRTVDEFEFSSDSYRMHRDFRPRVARFKGRTYIFDFGVWTVDDYDSLLLGLTYRADVYEIIPPKPGWCRRTRQEAYLQVP